MPIVKQYAAAIDTLNSSHDGTYDDLSVLHVLKKATGYDYYETLPGHNVPAWKDGMASVVNGFISKLDDSQIVCEAEVSSIEWNAASKRPGVEHVTIEFRDGSKVQAQCVTWTPSLNVTKGCIESGVFDPPLPKWKIDFLCRRYQGCVEKVFVVLDEPVKDVETDCTIPESGR